MDNEFISKKRESGDRGCVYVIKREVTAIKPIIDAIIRAKMDRLSEMYYNGRDIRYKAGGVTMEYTQIYTKDGKTRHCQIDTSTKMFPYITSSGLRHLLGITCPQDIINFKS